MIDNNGIIGNSADMAEISYVELRTKADKWPHELPILRVIDILTEMSAADLAGLMETAKRKVARREANKRSKS